jgi:hypothetical protein
MVDVSPPYQIRSVARELVRAGESEGIREIIPHRKERSLARLKGDERRRSDVHGYIHGDCDCFGLALLSSPLLSLKGICRGGNR